MSRELGYLTAEEVEQLSDIQLIARYREDVLQKIQEIDTQLSRAKQQADDDEVREWRHRALYAKNKLVHVLRILKRRQADVHASASVDRTQIDLNDPAQLVHALTALLHKIRREGVTLDHDELDLLITADQFVKQNPQ